MQEPLVLSDVKDHSLRTVPEEDYVAATGVSLSQDSNFKVGLQPGDLTKYSALPWQADFNECSIQNINITYE